MHTPNFLEVLLQHHLTCICLLMSSLVNSISTASVLCSKCISLILGAVSWQTPLVRRPRKSCMCCGSCSDVEVGAVVSARGVVSWPLLIIMASCSLVLPCHLCPSVAALIFGALAARSTHDSGLKKPRVLTDRKSTEPCQCHYVDACHNSPANVGIAAHSVEDMSFALATASSKCTRPSGVGWHMCSRLSSLLTLWRCHATHLIRWASQAHLANWSGQ